MKLTFIYYFGGGEESGSSLVRHKNHGAFPFLGVGFCFALYFTHID